jgi:hypothetical protein
MFVPLSFCQVGVFSFCGLSCNPDWPLTARRIAMRKTNATLPKVLSQDECLELPGLLPEGFRRDFRQSGMAVAHGTANDGRAEPTPPSSVLAIACQEKQGPVKLLLTCNQMVA